MNASLEWHSTSFLRLRFTFNIPDSKPAVGMLEHFYFFFVTDFRPGKRSVL